MRRHLRSGKETTGSGKDAPLGSMRHVLSAVLFGAVVLMSSR